MLLPTCVILPNLIVQVKRHECY